MVCGRGNEGEGWACVIIIIRRLRGLPSGGQAFTKGLALLCAHRAADSTTPDVHPACLQHRPRRTARRRIFGYSDFETISSKSQAASAWAWLGRVFLLQTHGACYGHVPRGWLCGQLLTQTGNSLGLLRTGWLIDRPACQASAVYHRPWQIDHPLISPPLCASGPGAPPLLSVILALPTHPFHSPPYLASGVSWYQASAFHQAIASHCTRKLPNTARH